MAVIPAKKGDLTLDDPLARLAASDALTRFQADWIKAIRPNLDTDAFARPSKGVDA